MRAGSNEEAVWESASLGEEKNSGKDAWRDSSLQEFLIHYLCRSLARKEKKMKGPLFDSIFNSP